MEKFLCGWIIFQLLLIGIAGVQIQNEIKDGIYGCKISKEHIPIWIGMVFPLVIFVPENTYIKEFCKDK